MKIVKLYKIIILILVLLTILSYSQYSYALTFEEIIEDGDGFISAGDSILKSDSETKLQKLSKFISNVLLTIAIGVTLVSASVMGINFMTQSVEEKAKIKESMVPWIIGIFISFGAYGIWTITINIFQTL